VALVILAASRRHRSALIGLFALALVLDGWMIWLHHDGESVFHNMVYCNGRPCNLTSGRTVAGDENAVVDVLLLFFPCLAGILLGAPMVAGETDGSTHRLAWTQGISRGRWLLDSYAVLAGGALVLVAVVLVIAQWWSGTAWLNIPSAIALGGDRIQPDIFSVSGVVPMAYTLFAVTLGAAAGAITRRTTAAIATTVVVYVLMAGLMVALVRPELAPTSFVRSDTTDSVQYAPLPRPSPWVVTYEYRVVAAAPARSRPTTDPDTIALDCSSYGQTRLLVRCLDRHGVEGGFETESPANFWKLQWNEAAIYLALTGAFGLLLFRAVRRLQD
jgi:hypothetical protein